MFALRFKSSDNIITMFNLIRRSFASFCRPKQTWSDAFKHFLEHDAGSSIRRQPHNKDRKYIHVQITQQFRKQEQARKQARLQHLRDRKRILQQKLSTQSKLLGREDQSSELSSINKELTTLQEILAQQQKQLANIQHKLQETEADLILVEGHKKLVVLNSIQYLKHLNYHPSGLVLHPDVMDMIENVHYLVNNNLPVNKYKLFEILPDVFETEIGELEDSMRKLIEEKKLDPRSDPSSRIRFFAIHHARFQDPEQDIIDIQEQRDEVFRNLELQLVKMMEPHEGYIGMVEKGLTPFRNTQHMIAVMISDCIKLDFTPEEEALKKTINQFLDMKEKFQIYSDEVDRKVVKMRHKYIQPPVYVKNHPVLMARYQKVMEKYMNPVEFSSTLPHYPRDDGGRDYLEQKLKKIVVEKYHPMIEELWNSGRKEELTATKKKFQIQFYQDSTKIWEEYQQMLAEQKEKEEFLKIPKKSRQIAQKKHTSLTLDELTKAIYVNNSNPQKYNLTFFSEYLGLESQEETRRLFNTFSYFRVFDQKESTIDDLKFEIIKFK